MYNYNCPDCDDAKLQSEKNARKINEVINQVNKLIEVNNEIVDFIEEKGNEVVEELAEIKVNEALGDFNTKLDNKADLNTVFSMANMGQDIKEAMTGGSVAVVGADTILTENIVNNQITPEKTTFIDVFNIFDYTKAEVLNLNKNANTGLLYSPASAKQSIIIKVKPNSKYNFSAVGINNQHIFTTENKPEVGEPAIRDIHFAENKTSDGRYYVDIETADNENYLLICFYKDGTTDTLEIRKSMQISEGTGLKQFYKYGCGVLSSDIKISNESIQENGINDLNVNILANKQLGSLEKGYLCISFDDGNAAAKTKTFPIIREKNVPVTFCCWTNSEIITNKSYLTELKELITIYKCSVAQHGEGDFTAYSGNKLYNYLKSEKEKWNNIGLSVSGLTYPNHKRNNHTRAISGNLFGVCQSGGTEYPLVYGDYNLSGARSNVFDMYRNSGASRTLAQLKSGIDEAYEKHMIYCVFWHDTNLSDEQEKQKLKDMIDYAKQKRIEFITIGDIEKAI